MTASKHHDKVQKTKGCSFACVTSKAKHLPDIIAHAGGSGSTINVSTLPQHFSGGAESDGSGRRVARPHKAAERIPEGSPYMDNNAQFQQEQQQV